LAAEVGGAMAAGPGLVGVTGSEGLRAGSAGAAWSIRRYSVGTRLY
jgi:hypothetical protein